MSQSVTELWAQRLVDATQLAKRQAFLDVGGGDGSLCATVESLSGAVGFLVDPAVDADSAPQNHFRATAEALPFSDSEFDAVILSHSAHFLKRPVVALREARRVVRPGGRIAVRFSSPQDLLALPLSRWKCVGFSQLASRAPSVKHVMTWGIRAGLQRCGFDLVLTPFAGTYEQWITGMNYIVEQAWLQSGCRGGTSPVKAFEALVRREYLTPEPFRESLLVFTRTFEPPA